MLAALMLEHPGRPGEEVARMRFGPVAMSTAADACALGEHVVPGSSWLRERFLAARQRAGRLRAHGTTARHI
jgi:hypothetical protein